MKLRLLPAVGLLATGLAFSGSMPAAADAACSPLEQLTSTTGGSLGNTNFIPSLDADGDRVAFVSSRNLTGDNPDLNGEVFLADQTADTLVQVSTTLGGGSPSSGPELSDGGTRLVFESVGDLVGDNADESSEVFLYDTTGPTLTQLTDVGETEFADSPDISGDGTDVAFRSNADPTGGNADGSEELFLVNATGTAAFTQLTTSATADSSQPSLNDTGSRVAFRSEANLVPGTGNADGNPDVFVRDAGGPTTVQLTATTGANGITGVTLSEDGTDVVFFASADLTGGNADGNAELFRRTISASSPVQLTSTTNGNSATAAADQTGDRIVFVSNSNQLARNGDGNQEAMVVDIGAGPNAMTVTTAPGATASPVLSDNGRVVAYSSTGNPFGTNGDGNQEIFIGRCGPRAPTFSDVGPTNPFFGQIQWMQDLGIADGFPNGTFKPLDAVKRQQMAAFMYNLAGQPAFAPPVTPTFSDVPPSHEFYTEIEWMAAEDIAGGFPNGTYKPRDAVKRQQMANFLYNLAGQPLFSAPGSPSFSDVPPTNPFFLQVEWMRAATVADGFPNGTFKPLDAVKRQQMANFMHNFSVSPGVDLD